MGIKRIAVVGGGISGITASAYLSKNHGTVVDLYESSGLLGGLVSSFSIGDMIYDIGTFIWSNDNPLFNIFPEIKKYFLPVEYNPVSVTGIDKYGRYPFSITHFYETYGLIGIVRTFFSRFYSHFKNRHPKNLDEECRLLLGSYFYKTSGLENYIKKFSGMTAKNIDSVFLNYRMILIKNITLRKLWKDYLLKEYGGIKKVNNDNFYIRKKIGYYEIFDCIGNILKSANVNILLNQTVKFIRPGNGIFKIYSDNNQKEYDDVFVSSPVDQTLKMLEMPVRLKKIYTSMYSIFYSGNVNINRSIIYNFSKIGDWKRLTNYSGYYGKISETDYFTVEVTANDSDKETEKEIIKKISVSYTHLRRRRCSLYITTSRS